MLPKLIVIHASLDFSETIIFKGVRFVDAEASQAYIHQITKDGFPIPASFTSSLEKAIELSKIKRTPMGSILEKY